MQRSAQSLRLLVLGAGDDAAAFRERAADAGAELAQRFSVRVTHVVVEEGVGEDDARVVRARGAGLPVLGLAEATGLIYAQDAAADDDEQAVADESDLALAEGGEELAAGGEGKGAAGGEDANRAVLGDVALKDVAPEGVAPESAEREGAVSGGDLVAVIRPRAEVVPEPMDGGPSDVFTGSALEAMMQFPPLPANEFEGGGEDEDGGGSGLGTAVGASVDDDASVDDETRSVLMDVAAEACACVEGEAETACGEERRASEQGCEAAGVSDVAIGVSEVVTEVGRIPDGGAAADGASGEGRAAAEGRASAADGAAAEGVSAADGGGRAAAAAGTVSSVAWASVPLVSLGLLTPVAVGYAAYRLRSRGLAIATACYTVAVVAAFAVSAVVPPHSQAQSIVGDLLTMCLAASCLGGTAHCFVLRRRVFRLSREG